MGTCECKEHQGGEQCRGTCGSSWSPTAGLGAQQVWGTAGLSPVIAAMPARGPLAQVPVPPPQPSTGHGCTAPIAVPVPAGERAEGQRQGQPSSSISSFSSWLAAQVAFLEG